MSKPSAFPQFIQVLRTTVTPFPAKRKGQNKHYAWVDAALGACAVFFTPSPSFLASQRDMTARKGQSKAHPLFGLAEIPSDNHIRALLDPVSPELRVPVFHQGLATLDRTPQLAAFRSWPKRLLVVLDGTQYCASQKLSCPPCATPHQAHGTTTYAPRMLTPVLVAPGQEKGIPRPPEFLVPQDGQDKQDWENAAAKRWLRQFAQSSRAYGMTMLGEELYSNPPLCEGLVEERLPFILVCQPDSPPTLSEELGGRERGKDLHPVTHRHPTPQGLVRSPSRYAAQLPLRATADALAVNGCDLTITPEQGPRLSPNAFVTQEPITQKNVAQLVTAGRTRWKVENENNNTLKTQGYQLEHNFGHGPEQLASLLATFNLLAFLLHPLLDLLDAKDRLLRQPLVSRKTFFDDLRALTRYVCFASWAHLLDFMLQGLEVEIPPNSS